MKYGAHMSEEELRQWFAQRERNERLARALNAEEQLDHDDELAQNDGAGLQTYKED
jgi:hypothetical protein